MCGSGIDKRALGLHFSQWTGEPIVVSVPIGIGKASDIVTRGGR